MILLSFFRLIRTVWVETRHMQADTMRRYPHLRD